MVGFLRRQGIEVVTCVTFGLRSGLEMGMNEPESIVEAAGRPSGGAADALFISCTALHVAPVFERISALQGRPVVTSNQALSWHALPLAGVTGSIANVGSWLCDRPVLDAAASNPRLRA